MAITMSTWNTKNHAVKKENAQVNKSRKEKKRKEIDD